MDSPGGSVSSDLRRQNDELRARLAGEAADHRRRLDAYRRAQQGQAALVSRLQAKVLQYKQRCSELEQHMQETTPRTDSYRAKPASATALPAPAALPSASSLDTRRDERIADLETALRRLDEEKRKCEKLVNQNNLLRDQLEESHQLNEALTNDLQKLTNDWEALRDEMTVKEDEWKDEEQAFNDYYTSEHNRLLSLWREVVSVKRFFSELQSTTERDLYKVKNDFESATRELVGTLSGYAINAYAQGVRPQSDHHSTSGVTSTPNITVETLRIDLREATSQRDAAQAELRERDARIQRLLGELQGLEERYEVAEAMCSEANAMRSALEEVARALIQDSEADVPSQHLHMADSSRSPRRGVSQAANATAFAESTISAVQAALHKYQIQIHELQVKLQNTREQLSTSRKHCEAADSNILTLENKVQDLQAKLDQANTDLNQLVQDKESLQKSVESLRIDKNNLERNRVEINAMVESLTSDYEKLQKINARLEKTIEALETDKRNLNSEVDHLHRESTNRESILRAEEERSSRLRSELVTVREELNKTSLARDLLEQQKMEADSIMSQVEKHRSKETKLYSQQDLAGARPAGAAEDGSGLHHVAEEPSRLRSELVTVREELNKTSLARDLLEQQKMEADSIMSQVEKHRKEPSRLRSELVTVREELNKTSLARDLLEQQKMEADSIMSQVEKHRKEPSRLRSELVTVREQLNKTSLARDLLEQQKMEADSIMSQVEKHRKEPSRLRSELVTVREQLNKTSLARDLLEQQKMEADSIMSQVEKHRREPSRLCSELVTVREELNKTSLARDLLEQQKMEADSIMSQVEKHRKGPSRLRSELVTVREQLNKTSLARDLLEQQKMEADSIMSQVEKHRKEPSRLRSELVTVREELNKTSLARDLLEQQKMEADSIMSQVEKHRNDLEIELERTLLERGDLQDLVEKMQAVIRNLETDKKKLHEEVKHLEDEKSSLSNQSSEQMGDLNSLRKELLAAEQTRMELEADKSSLHEKIKFLDQDREKVELELRQVVRERGELSSQLTAMVRKKDSLNEEIMRLQQRLEQASETVGRLNRTLEDHVKDAEEKQILIDSLDKDKQHLQEQLASVRAEKDALEAVLFDTANMLDDAEARRAKLDRDLQDAMVQQENHKGQIARLTKELDSSERKLRETKSSLQQSSGKKEAEYQSIITNINRTTAENITKLKEEKEQLRQTLEQKLSQTIAALTSEKEASDAGAREREKKLLAQRDQLILQHDEAMLRAESDKQQALIMVHQEQQALLERLEEAKRVLDCSQNKLERVKRDAAARSDQDRGHINQLKDELAALKTRLEEAKAAAEDECARFENRIKELHLEKEASNRECQEARAQLSLAEDKYDNAYTQLQDTIRKLKELENESESLRKELTDVRRQLSNCAAERDKYNSSCRELREHVKRAEHERREAARARDEAVHSVATLEENRSSLELELSRLQNMLKESETGGEHVTRELRATEAQLKRERAALEQANHDIKELQSRLQNECEERERTANEAAAARRHGAELEALLGAARADLAASRQRGAELEEACRARDQVPTSLNECEERERTANEAAAARRHGAELEALLGAARADLAASRQRGAELEEACRARDQNECEERERTANEAAAARRHGAELEALLGAARADLAASRQRGAELEEACRARDQNECEERERTANEAAAARRHGAELEALLGAARADLAASRQRGAELEEACRARDQNECEERERTANEAAAARRHGAELEALLGAARADLAASRQRGAELEEACRARDQNECEERERTANEAAAARRHGAELEALLGAARADLAASRQRGAELEEACRARDQVPTSLLQNECEERERTANEAAAARRHGAELEALLGAARADLAASRQRGAELEEACRARDQELLLRLEDCRSKERRLEELKHNLEVCLADATQQIQELKARLGGSEGRCRALEASLAQCEHGKREAEAKLSSIAHTLRRVCGVQPDGSVHAAARRRLASPARRYSPHRGRDHSEDRNEIIDVDPELVKKGVRNLMHEVCQIEREKDDYKTQVSALKKQLKDASEQQGKGDNKLQSITSNLRTVQEEKARLQNLLGQKDAQLTGLNESVQSKTVEISNLRDKITSLEATLSSVTEEKVQNENKGENLRVQLAERVQEVGQLREALAAAEGRAARLDVRRAQLEGDVQRAAVAARDRDQALKKLQERCEGYARTIASLEDRCTSLKGTVEQLSTSLQKAASAESELRAELSKTQRMLNEAKNNEQNAMDKLRQIQKNIGKFSFVHSFSSKIALHVTEGHGWATFHVASKGRLCRERAQSGAEQDSAHAQRGEEQRAECYGQIEADSEEHRSLVLRSRCTLLKGTVGQLSTSLQKAASAESELRAELSKTQRMLNEAKNNEQNAMDKLRQIQKNIGHGRSCVDLAKKAVSAESELRAELSKTQRMLNEAKNNEQNAMDKLRQIQKNIGRFRRTSVSFPLSVALVLRSRCTLLKGTVGQLSTSLQKAASAESELRAELSKTQRMLNEAKNNEQNAMDKLRQIQKNIANCENERRVLSEKLESAKSALVELKRLNCTLEDQVHRLTTQLANVEVQRSGLESQLRMTTWDGKESADSEMERELHALQRERNELKAKLAVQNDALQETARKVEADRRLNRTSALRSKSHDRTEKTVYYSDLDSGPDSTKDSMRYKDSNLSAGRNDKSFRADLTLLELENRELKMKIRRMEKELADKEAELKLARTRYLSDLSTASPSRREDTDHYRQAALQAERLLEAREASHRQQIIRLENQASQLRSQLSAEIRRRQSYVARSGRAARDVQRLRSALGDSLRTVSQDPALDSYTLEHEARKLDSTLAHSLPPLNDSYDSSK
ncbi:rootletin [Cydia amplana]|uniref:rootletin n=1 Tax=Cydia amplana TaxID=1869771 RepID=UPI002FE6B8D0